MLENSEIYSIVNWLQDKSKTLQYGYLSVEIKLSGKRPPLIKKTVSEQYIFVDGAEIAEKK